jgi:triosephosphate isomerase
MIFVNFKTYQKASGEAATSLAHTICDVSGEMGIEIISCPQAVDLKKVVKASDHPVWAQNTDFFDRGRATGWLPAEVVKEAGAEGTLLNHSEHKLSTGQLGEVLGKCKSAGLKTLVFADSLEEAKVVAKFKPDFVGYEPPELIASPDTSVARAKQEIIEEVVKAIPSVPVIVGAGVKDGQDVSVSLKLGAKGVALSSAVTKADDPKSVLTNLAEGFK